MTHLFTTGVLVLPACLLLGTPLVTESGESQIMGHVWRLVEIQQKPGGTISIKDPDKYTFTLKPDGRVLIRADCNRGFGTYTVQGNRLSLDRTAYTRAMCPPGSFFDLYTRSLELANSYEVQRGHLSISYGPDGGILMFVR